MLRRNRGDLPTAYGSGGGGGSFDGAGGGGGAYYGGENVYNSGATSSNSHSYKRHGRSSSRASSTFTDNKYYLLSLVLAFFFLCTTLVYRSRYSALYSKAYGGSNTPDVFLQIDSLRAELADAHKNHEREMRESRNEMHIQKRKIDQLEKRERKLLKDNEERNVDLASAVQERQDSVKRVEKTLKEKSEKRETALKSQIATLREKISIESRRDAEEKYGPGPHKVDITVEMPTSQSTPQNKQHSNETFTVELASLDEMPHSIHLFLEQVHHKLWDGTSFLINAPHILQAGPHAPLVPGKPVHDKEMPFAKAKLDTVSFQEYSDARPHSKYTIGYAGRPGGPDFYVNKIDNTANHGPGGQGQHDLEEEADPCFGNIVDGRDVVDKMFTLPMDMNNGFLMMDPVHIVSARIVSSGGATTEEKKESTEETNENDEKTEGNDKEEKVGDGPKK